MMTLPPDFSPDYPYTAAPAAALSDEQRLTAIESAVSNDTGIPIEAIHDLNHKTKDLVQARWAVWILARELTRLSYPRIACLTGGWNHAAVMNGCRKGLPADFVHRIRVKVI